MDTSANTLNRKKIGYRYLLLYFFMYAFIRLAT